MSVNLRISLCTSGKQSKRTLKNLIRLSPPQTTPTGTRALGCQTKSTTPLPPPCASFLPVVGFAWFAFRSLCISIVPCGRGDLELPAIGAELSMKDLVDEKRDERDGTPVRILPVAQSGRGCIRSNLYISRCKDGMRKNTLFS